MRRFSAIAIAILTLSVSTPAFADIVGDTAQEAYDKEQASEDLIDKYNASTTRAEGCPYAKAAQSRTMEARSLWSKVNQLAMQIYGANITLAQRGEIQDGIERAQRRASRIEEVLKDTCQGY
jgi:hypothetical protein